MILKAKVVKFSTKCAKLDFKERTTEPFYIIYGVDEQVSVSVNTLMNLGKNETFWRSCRVHYITSIFSRDEI